MMHIEKALDRDTAVLRNMLQGHARTRGDAVFVHFFAESATQSDPGDNPGDVWSYAETLRRVERRATALRALGVRQGDPVLTFLDNGPDLLVTWFAINYLGAVYVPMNTALVGAALDHVLSDAGADVMVTRPDLAARLAQANLGTLRKVRLVECDVDRLGSAHPDRERPGLATSDPGSLEPSNLSPGNLNSSNLGLEIPGLDLGVLLDPDLPGKLDLDRPIEPWDVQAIMYTSGTTGHAKGVMSSYTQLYTMGPDAFDCVSELDRCLICGPIFHCGSTLYVYTMLARGLSVGMMRSFKTDTFWPAVRQTGSTYALLLGVMASFLLKSPPRPDDRKHSLTHVFIVPFGEDGPAFGDRFGVDVYTIYNMTEIASPLHAGPGIVDKGLAGRLRPWFEARIVDDNDIESPIGEVGELVLRSSRPWAMMSGYLNRPEATAEAMRNGWFHTGDSFRRDAAGRYFFVDRQKDVIRRRGENISSFALEGEVLAHDAVRECAAVAVPSEHSEDDVMIVVTPVAGARIDPQGLVAWLTPRVPRYMVPRYVRVIEDLPKTASGKIQKHVLRSCGAADDCWDREVSG